jgi:hypothetical protein
VEVELMVKDEVESVTKKVVAGAYNLVAKYLLLILAIIVLVLIAVFAGVALGVISDAAYLVYEIAEAGLALI